MYIQFDKARSTTALFSVRSTEVFLRLQYYQNGPLTFSSKSFSNRLSPKRFRRLDSIMEPELNSRSTSALLGSAVLYLTYNCLMCGCLSNIAISLSLSLRCDICFCDMFDGTSLKMKKSSTGPSLAPSSCAVPLDDSVLTMSLACLAPTGRHSYYAMYRYCHLPKTV